MTDPSFSAKHILHQPSDVYGGIQAGLSQSESASGSSPPAPPPLTSRHC